jgi:hypothetical protein
MADFLLARYRSRLRLWAYPLAAVGDFIAGACPGGAAQRSGSSSHLFDATPFGSSGVGRPGNRGAGNSRLAAPAFASLIQTHEIAVGIWFLGTPSLGLSVRPRESATTQLDATAESRHRRCMMKEGELRATSTTWSGTPAATMSDHQRPSRSAPI